MTTDARSLTIKTNVVSRTRKEFASYLQELEANEKKIQEIRKSSDHSKLKQWENVYTETQGMIPDTESRLRSALVELETEMATPAFDGTAEQKSAKEEVESAKEALAKRAAN